MVMTDEEFIDFNICLLLEYLLHRARLYRPHRHVSPLTSEVAGFRA